MAYQVKKSYVTIVTLIIGFLGYGGFVLSVIETPLTIYNYGMYIFIALPVLVVLNIVGKIIFDLLNRTSEKKEEPKSPDEFDRIIEYKSIRNFSFTFITGFFTSLALLWLGTLLASFILLFVFIFASGLVLQLSYIVYYTKGV